MSEEMTAAVQAVQVTSQIGFQTFSILVKSASALSRNAIKLFTWIYHSKPAGGVSVRRLLAIKGDDLQVFRFREKNLAEVEKQLKDHGVLYTVLEDLNLKDGFREVMFSSSSASRVNEIAKNLEQANIIGFDDYVNNADPKDMKNVMRKADRDMSEKISEMKQKTGKTPGNFQMPPDRETGITIDLSRLKEGVFNEEIGRMEWKMELTPSQKDEDKKLYALVDVDEVWRHEKDASFIPAPEKKYKIMDHEGSVIETMPGEELLSVYFPRIRWGNTKPVPAETNGGKTIDFTSIAYQAEFISYAEQSGMYKVGFPKELIVAEQANSYTMLLPPQSPSEPVYCATFLKKNSLPVDGGNKVYTLLSEKKNYILTDTDGEPLIALRGNELAKKYFDDLTGEVKRTGIMEKVPEASKEIAETAGKTIEKVISSNP